jgi:hypothetical protein
MWMWKMSFLPRPKAAQIGALATSMMITLSMVSAQAADASCEGLASAMITNAKTPYRSMSIITFDAGDNAKPASSQTSETISTGTAVFARFGSGKWQEIHIPLDKLALAVRHNAESFSGCKRLADDTINGEAVAVYTGHLVAQKSVVETRVWVEPKRGVMLRSETDVVSKPEPGDVSKGRHVAIRYSYDNIAAPPLD